MLILGYKHITMLMMFQHPLRLEQSLAIALPYDIATNPIPSNRLSCQVRHVNLTDLSIFLL
jgi:hypothetical protein